MKVFAADLSLTASGFSVGVDGKITNSGVIPGQGDGMARLLHIRNRVMDNVDRVKPDLVVFEDFSYGSSDGKAFERAGVAYMIRAELYSDGVPFACVSPMSLKKFVCGTAGSKKDPRRKEHVLKEIFRRFGHDVTDNNQADAIGLGYVGMALVGDWSPTIEAQGQVLAVVLKNHPFIVKQFGKIQVGQPTPVEW